MKVLIVGGGAREHALAWKLRRDDPSIELIAAPGNAGVAELARCVPVRGADIDGLLALALAERVNLTVVGEETPLAAGIVDRFRAAGLPIFGPTRAAAQIEASKAFAKSLMAAAGVPTARASTHTSQDSARAAARELGFPVVIKASGLAAGKGVSVCMDAASADRAIAEALGSRVFGDAGDVVLVEEFMEGEELSIFFLTDGERVVPFLPAQDHKRLRDGDEGPNTGGMGAYAPVSLATPLVLDTTLQRIVIPTLAALREKGSPFTGVLYAGLMLTATGPRVIEFNCRFGDPETEAILPLMESRLLDLLLAVASGDGLTGSERIRWSDSHSVCTVVAAPGYPEAPIKGRRLVCPAPPPNVQVFHAGTTRGADGSLVASGGRVLAVTAVESTLEAAQSKSLAYADAVQLDGKQLRRDIGWREARRHAGAA